MPEAFPWFPASFAFLRHVCHHQQKTHLSDILTVSFFWSAQECTIAASKQLGSPLTKTISETRQAGSPVSLVLVKPLRPRCPRDRAAGGGSPAGRAGGERSGKVRRGRLSVISFENLDHGSWSVSAPHLRHVPWPGSAQCSLISKCRSRASPLKV